MHNQHTRYALNTTANDRSKPSHYVCCHRRREEHQCSRNPNLRSQPAITRALQRARIALHVDDLLVRSIGFEPTLRGRKILQELERLLPRLEDMMEPRAFDPQTESSHFRLCGPDNICAEIIPALCRKHSVEDYLVTFDFAPWSSDALDALEKGKLDLVLSIDDGLLPSHFQSEKLAREEWVCVVARNSKFGNSFTLKQYLSAAHLVVGTLPGVQTIPDKQCSNALGVKRRFSVRLPYFGAALNCLSGTNLVLTLTSGMSDLATCSSRLRLVQAPRQLEASTFFDGLASASEQRRATSVAATGSRNAASRYQILGSSFNRFDRDRRFRGSSAIGPLDHDRRCKHNTDSQYLIGETSRPETVAVSRIAQTGSRHAVTMARVASRCCNPAK